MDKGVSVEEVVSIEKETLVKKEMLVPVETNISVSKGPTKEMDVPVNSKRVEESTTRTGRKLRKPDRLIEQFTVALSDIGYGNLLGLLPGHEYTEGEKPDNT